MENFKLSYETIFYIHLKKCQTIKNIVKKWEQTEGEAKHEIFKIVK